MTHGVAIWSVAFWRVGEVTINRHHRGLFASRKTNKYFLKQNVSSLEEKNCRIYSLRGREGDVVAACVRSGDRKVTALVTARSQTGDAAPGRNRTKLHTN